MKHVLIQSKLPGGIRTMNWLHKPFDPRETFMMLMVMVNWLVSPGQRACFLHYPWQLLPVIIYFCW